MVFGVSVAFGLGLRTARAPGAVAAGIAAGWRAYGRWLGGRCWLALRRRRRRSRFGVGFQNVRRWLDVGRHRRSGIRYFVRIIGEFRVLTLCSLPVVG